MNDSAIWAQFFLKWPPKLAQRGVVVTAWGDQIPFAGFLRTNDTILLERQTPDAIGARKVLLPYSQIVSVKIVDPVGPETFNEVGFQGQLTSPS